MSELRGLLWQDSGAKGWVFWQSTERKLEFTGAENRTSSILVGADKLLGCRSREVFAVNAQISRLAKEETGEEHIRRSAHSR